MTFESERRVVVPQRQLFIGLGGWARVVLASLGEVSIFDHPGGLIEAFDPSNDLFAGGGHAGNGIDGDRSIPFASQPERAPIGLVRTELNVLKAGIGHHFGYLSAGEAPFKARAETVKCVGAHRIEALVAIGA